MRLATLMIHNSTGHARGAQMRRSAGLAIVAVGWLFNGALPSGAMADVVYLGQRAEVTIVWYACPVKGDLQRLKAFSRGSQGAAARFSNSHHCLILHPGDTAIVEDASIWTGDTCLILKPRAECYWFPERFVKRSKSSSSAAARRP
jgi:hypothetical protein